ncbi:MAG: hypothetical protein Q8M29_11525 [Bacteroidota bacterium]|nr:hypothetical protein [Bacteroidota bacterium]
MTKLDGLSVNKRSSPIPTIIFALLTLGYFGYGGVNLIFKGARSFIVPEIVYTYEIVSKSNNQKATIRFISSDSAIIQTKDAIEKIAVAKLDDKIIHKPIPDVTRNSYATIAIGLLIVGLFGTMAFLGLMRVYKDARRISILSWIKD